MSERETLPDDCWWLLESLESCPGQEKEVDDGTPWDWVIHDLPPMNGRTCQ